VRRLPCGGELMSAVTKVAVGIVLVVAVGGVVVNLAVVGGGSRAGVVA